MNKDLLIQKAKEINFVSEFLCNNPYKYSTKEDLRLRAIALFVWGFVFGIAFGVVITEIIMKFTN